MVARREPQKKEEERAFSTLFFALFKFIPGLVYERVFRFFLFFTFGEDRSAFFAC